MTKIKKDKDVITKEEENNAAEYCRENNDLSSKLGYLTETIAYDMAERASQTFIKIVKLFSEFGLMAYMEVGVYAMK